MQNFARIFLACWIVIFFIGWAISAGQILLDGHFIIGGLLTMGFTYAINVGIGIAQGVAGKPPQEDP